nr:DUF3471 domain-containing protein [Chloroflexia bacterium]
PIESYVGEYEHPGYGVVEFALRDGKPVVWYNGLEFQTVHYQYDTFDLTLERWDQTFKATFSANARGDIETMRIPFEAGVSDITFTRLPNRALRQLGYLERFVGDYNLAGEHVVVALQGEDTLLAHMPFRPPMVLVPYQENRFTAQGLSGYEVGFVLDAEGQVAEAIITQPGTVQTARKT